MFAWRAALGASVRSDIGASTNDTTWTPAQAGAKRSRQHVAADGGPLQLTKMWYAASPIDSASCPELLSTRPFLASR